MAASIEETAHMDYCEIEATVVTGFEFMAKDEVKEKLNVVATHNRGKINFNTKIKDVTQILELQSVDNLYVILKHIDEFGFTKEKATDLEKLVPLVPSLNWELGLSVWKKFFNFKDLSANPTPGWEERFKETEEKIIDRNQQSQGEKKITTESSNEIEPPAKIVKKDVTDLPSFRATCYRTGTNHSFQSPDAARRFGGAVQDYFGWNVDLKNHNIEVVLNIDSNSGYVAIALTKESLHKRNITEFGPTTLRPTIAYNMLRLCKIKKDEVVCDPMCGGGSIPIEGAINWPSAKHLCGDMHEKAVPRCQGNINSLNAKRLSNQKQLINIGLCHWDTTRLPLNDNSIDVFISDMPFGKRSGTLMRNWHLYPKALAEMARCSKTASGRACLLTQDKKCFTKTLGLVKNYWSVATVVGINIGGLAACVWLLNRTDTEYKGLQQKQ